MKKFSINESKNSTFNTVMDCMVELEDHGWISDFTKMYSRTRDIRNVSIENGEISHIPKDIIGVVNFSNTINNNFQKWSNKNDFYLIHEFLDRLSKCNIDFEFYPPFIISDNNDEDDGDEDGETVDKTKSLVRFSIKFVESSVNQKVIHDLFNVASEICKSFPIYKVAQWNNFIYGISIYTSGRTDIPPQILKELSKYKSSEIEILYSKDFSLIYILKKDYHSDDYIDKYFNTYKKV